MNIGIDIGSTTVKVVVMDDENNILHKSYERHFSKVREKSLEMLKDVEPMLAGKQVKIAITGSAGMGVANAAEIGFVQEVYATAGAVDEFIEDVGTVVELGGEDAKIIFFKGGLEERMNGTCAGGTGAFIDQMATLLGITINELDEYSLRHETIYSIASRCGVFAKSDIQPLLNQGATKEDLSASILQAVVNQTISGLVQGRKIEQKVVFLGGPLFFLKGLRDRFVKTLDLTEENAVFPENSDCFVAIGAALHAKKLQSVKFDDIIKAIGMTTAAQKSILTMPPLFDSEEQYKEFQARHSAMSVPQVDINTYSGVAYLGIDAGSTTTKLALITPDGGLLYTYYASNKGNPVKVVLEELKKIYALCGDRITIKGSAVTGYGEDIIKNAFLVDVGIVETVAHYKAAQHFNPKVDFIIDIGGQDMKCFKIRNNAVDSIMLNEACSSGCGSFIETFATALGYSIIDFAKLGIFARHPVDLGSRCTVFMNSSVKQAQKDGASVADISAGLAISVIKNAIYKVIRASSADALGQNVVVQGGTFLNDAILRSFELELGRNVTRPAISGIMGAFGAALIAKKENLEKSGLISIEGLENFGHKVSSARCQLCGNHCNLTISKFADGRKFISNNRCERPNGMSSKKKLPNVFEYKLNIFKNFEGSGSRGKIGIPLGLNYYDNLPFWHEFFTALDYEVVISPPSTREIYNLGYHTIPSDTVCYPAKIMHGHVEALLNTGINVIFHPCLPYNIDYAKGDNHYNCPIVAYYPELIKANVDRLAEIRYLTPYFGLHRKGDFLKRAKEYFTKELNVTKSEVAAATKRAFKAYEKYKDDIQNKGEECLKYARDNGKEIIVLAGRPYHIDPEINHGIDEMIARFDLVVVSEDSIAHLAKRPKLRVLDQWTNPSLIYLAANYVTTQEDMNLIQLISFGCGIDAITADEVQDILERGGKLYTQLKIDEISNLGAAKIRVRSLLAAIDARKNGGM